MRPKDPAGSKRWIELANQVEFGGLDTGSVVLPMDGGYLVA